MTTRRRVLDAAAITIAAALVTLLLDHDQVAESIGTGLIVGAIWWLGRVSGWRDHQHRTENTTDKEATRA